jgi:hypothetical protein
MTRPSSGGAARAPSNVIGQLWLPAGRQPIRDCLRTTKLGCVRFYWLVTVGQQCIGGAQVVRDRHCDGAQWGNGEAR